MKVGEYIVFGKSRWKISCICLSGEGGQGVVGLLPDKPTFCGSKPVDEMLIPVELADYLSAPTTGVSRDTKVSAASILEAAAAHMQDRATVYDKPGGERSMPPTVAAFNAITGHNLTEEQGWLFMELLKCVRAEHNGYRPDNYEDGAAYCALKGEAAARNRAE